MDRRARIIDAARQLFLAKGYAAVSMDEILDAVGGSKATLYRYFPSKSALFLALIETITAEVMAPGPPEHLYDVPLEEALTGLGVAMATAALSPQAEALYRLVHAEALTHPEAGRLFYERGPATSYANLRAFLEAKRARGELDFDDAQTAAEHFMSPIVGLRQVQLALGVIEPPGPAEVGRVVAAVVRTFVAAYGVRPQPSRRAPRPAPRRR
jgi:TetR/AcrR family transcriptional regulator, mexJK operon transcriptional repressor